MELTKQDILKIREYRKKIRAFNQKFKLSPEEIKEKSHEFESMLSNMVKNGEEINNEMIYIFIAQTIEAANASTFTNDSSRPICKKLNYNMRTTPMLNSITNFDNDIFIPDDLIFKDNEFITEDKTFNFRNEKILPKELNVDEFNFIKFNSNKDDVEKFIQNLNQLVIDSRIVKENDKKYVGVKDHYLLMSCKALLNLENIFVVDTKEENKYKSANQALITYFFQKKYGVANTSLKNALKTALNIDDEQLELLESAVLQNNTKKFKDISQYTKSISKSIDSKIKNINIDYNHHFVNEFYKTKDQIQKSKEVNDVLTEVVMYKKCKEAYADSTKSTGFFDWIKKYFSKQAREMRKDMSNIEKSLKSEGIKLNKIDFKQPIENISNDLATQLNNNKTTIFKTAIVFGTLSNMKMITNKKDDAVEKIENIEIEENNNLEKENTLDNSKTEVQKENDFVKETK